MPAVLIIAGCIFLAVAVAATLHYARPSPKADRNEARREALRRHIRSGID